MKFWKTGLLWLLICSYSSVLSAQSPGGVDANLQLWLRADQGAPTDGAGNLTGWMDNSTQSHNADLLFSDPALIEGGLNFNPMISFDGNDFLRFSTSPFINSFTEGEVFSVVKDNDFAGRNGYPYDFGGARFSNTASGHHYTWQDGAIYQGTFSTDRFGFNPNDNTITVAKPGVTAATGQTIDPTKFNLHGTYGKSGDWGVLINGELRAESSINTFSTELRGGDEHIGAVSGGVWQGDMPEVILYDRTLTDTERKQVNTYLGVKYGLSLAHDYITSDPALTAWSYGNNYDGEITGIGRDDQGGLNQKQSQSILDTTLTIGLGNIATSNANNAAQFSSDKDFLVWGHNGGALYFENPFADNYNYASRIWKVAETGTVGSVRVRMSRNNLPGGSMELIISTDDAISVADQRIPMTIAGDYFVADADFTDGQYFTFALRPDFLVTATDVTCVGPLSNADGTLTIDSEIPGLTKVGFSAGPTYTGPSFADADPISSLPQIVVDNLSNPETLVIYTVRGYVTETFFRDYMVALNKVVCATAELTVSITSPDTDANAGEIITYTVTVRNNGPDPAAGVQVRVDIPPTLEFLTASGTNGTYSSVTQLWKMDQILLNAEEVLTIKYRMK